MLTAEERRALAGFDAVRITGKDRDVLQEAIALVRKEIADLPLTTSAGQPETVASIQSSGSASRLTGIRTSLFARDCGRESLW